MQFSYEKPHFFFLQTNQKTNRGTAKKRPAVNKADSGSAIKRPKQKDFLPKNPEAAW